MLVVLAVLLVLYDLAVYAIAGNDATISRVCLNCAQNNRGLVMVTAFCCGVLFGHLFLPQHVK